MHNGYVAEIEHFDQPDLKQFIKDKNNLTFVCLDEVTDPRNIGSLIRSAASFNIILNNNGVLLLGLCGCSSMVER